MLGGERRKKPSAGWGEGRGTAASTDVSLDDQGALLSGLASPAPVESQVRSHLAQWKASQAEVTFRRTKSVSSLAIPDLSFSVARPLPVGSSSAKVGGRKATKNYKIAINYKSKHPDSQHSQKIFNGSLLYAWSLAQLWRETDMVLNQKLWWKLWKKNRKLWEIYLREDGSSGMRS